MASINKAILIGNAGRDAESRTFASGDKITSVRIATTETWKDKQTGEKREATEWHALVFRGGLADVAEKYIKKGTSLYVEGRIKTRKYTQDNVEKYTTEIHVDVLKLLSGRPDGAGAPAPAPTPAQRAAAPKPAQGFDDMDSDIPF